MSDTKTPLISLNGHAFVDQEARSEVQGVRTGYDGTVYNSAGEAVRAQVQRIIGEADTPEQPIVLNYTAEQYWGINNTTNKVATMTYPGSDFVRYDPIPVAAGKQYKVFCEGYFYNPLRATPVFFVDADYNLLYGLEGIDGSSTIDETFTAPDNSAFLLITERTATPKASVVSASDSSGAVSLNSLQSELEQVRSDLDGLINDVETLGAKVSDFFTLTGKRINWIGDSIVAGADFDELVCSYFGMTLNDYGSNGATIGYQNGTTNSISQNYANMGDADIIAVSAGTNDFAYSFNDIGTAEDTTNYTFYGALKVLCEGLLAKYPEKIIFFTTPIKRKTEQYPLPSSVNGKGKTLKDYADIIKEVCGMYSIPVCDLYNESMLNPHLASQEHLFDDGTHPNDAGRAIMARRVIGWLKQLC